MNQLTVAIFILSLVASAWCFSGGAPESVCDDMLPKHHVPAQKTAFPYKITLDKNDVPPEGEVNISVNGKKFKGVLLQVRNDEGKSVGEFQIPKDETLFKTINCHGASNSAVTHTSKDEKSTASFLWKAPKTAGKYTVYATVAENGITFWVAQPSGVINVN